MNVQTFRKKTGEVQAVQLTTETFHAAACWTGDEWALNGGKYAETSQFLTVNEDEDDEFTVYLNDWIVLENDEFRRVKADDFAATFEAVRPGGEPA